MKQLLVCILALFAVVNGFTQAKHIETDRPNETDVPYLVLRKWFQFETGIRIEKMAEDNKVYSYPTMLVKYGLSRKLEIRARTSVSSEHTRSIPNNKTASGLEPVEIGFKAEVLEEKKWIPLTALMFQTGIPQFSSGAFKTNRLSPILRILMENNISDKFSINYNAGAEWSGHETEPAWIYTITPGLDIGEHIHLFVEAYSYVQRKEAPELTLDGGLEYFIGENIGLDVCSGFGVNKSASPFFITIGGSIRFR